MFLSDCQKYKLFVKNMLIFLKILKIFKNCYFKIKIIAILNDFINKDDFYLVF